MAACPDERCPDAGAARRPGDGRVCLPGESLRALGDSARAFREAIFVKIAASEGLCIGLNFIEVNEKTVPKSTLSQHFRALREAGLIRGERRGVEMHNTSRCAEIEGHFPGLLGAIFSAHQAQAKRKAAQRE